MKVKRLAGKKFGRLTAICINDAAKPRQWRCNCACGSECVVTQSMLISGRKMSCGCWRRSPGEKRTKPRQRCIHPYQQPLYQAWTGIKDRCYNPKNQNYHNYGGRGVVMCKKWRDNPRAFMRWALDNGWRPGLQVDKDIKSKGTPTYSPETCSIVTQKENCRHTRRSRMLTFNGETKCIAEWAEITGIDSGVIAGRINNGWAPERALTQPVRKKHPCKSSAIG